MPPRQAQPGSIDAGEGGGDTTGSTRSRSSSLFISDVLHVALLLLLMLVPWYSVFYDLPPQFSVQLEPTGRLNASSSSPAASASFRATLHASNRRATERCYRHGDGAVTYGGFAVASGRVPSFCVPGKGHREVPFVLVRKDDDGAAGVGLLPEHLRDRAADEAAMAGALELEVQVKLLQGGSRPTRMWCTARVGTAQPPEPAMCTVFALQNWFDLDA